VHSSLRIKRSQTTRAGKDHTITAPNNVSVWYLQFLPVLNVQLRSDPALPQMKTTMWETSFEVKRTWTTTLRYSPPPSPTEGVLSQFSSPLIGRCARLWAVWLCRPSAARWVPCRGAQAAAAGLLPAAAGIRGSSGVSSNLRPAAAESRLRLAAGGRLSATCVSSPQVLHGATGTPHILSAPS
jgi:hypothetical protein